MHPRDARNGPPLWMCGLQWLRRSIGPKTRALPIDVGDGTTELTYEMFRIAACSSAARFIGVWGRCHVAKVSGGQCAARARRVHLAMGVVPFRFQAAPFDCGPPLVFCVAVRPMSLHRHTAHSERRRYYSESSRSRCSVCVPTCLSRSAHPHLQSTQCSKAYLKRNSDEVDPPAWLASRLPYSADFDF